MANINTVFSSGNALKGADLPKGKRIKVTIEKVTLQTYDNKEEGGVPEQKLQLHFVGKEKYMVCNKTNAVMIAGVYGEETDDWMGREIYLFFDPSVQYKGQVTGGIRVAVPMPEPTAEDGDAPF